MDLDRINEAAHIPFEHSELSLPFLIGSAGVFTLACVNSKYTNLREGLPDPLELFNHLGNAGPSLLIGSLTGIATVVANEEFDVVAEQIDSPHRLKQALLVGGLTVGVIANSIAESKYGSFLKDDGIVNTVDMIDWVWGVASTAFGARFVNRFRKISR